MRRLLRRAIRYSFDLGIEQNFRKKIVPTIADLHDADFSEVKNSRDNILLSSLRKRKPPDYEKGLRQMQYY